MRKHDTAVKTITGRKKVGLVLMAIAVGVLLLGLTLTIYGVTGGIGTFSDFLRGDVSSEEIKTQVAQITAQLGKAMIAMLISMPIGLVLAIAGAVVFTSECRKLGPTMPSSVPLTRGTPPAGQEPRLGSRSAHG